MSKINVSKELIVAIAEQSNDKYTESVTSKVNQILSEALEQISTKISYVSLENIVLQPVNELMSGAVIDNSSFIYFLGINNPQLEINTLKRTPLWEKFKIRVKIAWANRKLYKNKKKKKKKKQQIQETSMKNDFDPMKYTIYNLTEDLQNSIINFISESSIVYAGDNLLKIIGKEDFGGSTNILIYVVNYDNKVYKFHNRAKNKVNEINMISRYTILQDKINLIGENFIKILKILNALFLNANGYIPNQIFMESILSACPHDLFKGDDIYNCFLKIINYLSIKTLKDITSNNNIEKTIYEDPVCGYNTILGFNKMLNLLSDK